MPGVEGIGTVLERRRRAARGVDRDRSLAEGTASDRGRGPARACRSAGRARSRRRLAVEQRRRFDRLVERRATGEPIPLSRGTRRSGVSSSPRKPGVFVPRDSSEFLAEQAVRRLRRRDGLRCTSTSRPVRGTIALAVANEVPQAQPSGPIRRRRSSPSRARTRGGSGLRAGSGRATCSAACRGSCAGTVDVVTLHPPYVPMGELKDLPEEIRAWEPAHTLTDRSHDGLGLITRTAREAPAWLCARRAGS